MASSQSEKSKGLPNPYAKGVLPNPYAAVIEGPPVLYTEEEAKAAALKKPAFHNPHTIKRPQAKNAQTVKRPKFMPAMASSSSDAGPSTANEPPNSPPNEQRNIDYWRSTAEDDAETLEWRRQQDRERRTQEKRDKEFAKKYGKWYPSQPYTPKWKTNFRAYQASKVHHTKMDDFNEFLKRYATQTVRSRQDSSDSAASTRPTSKSSGTAEQTVVATSETRAPPKASSGMSFAPPASHDQEPATKPATAPIKPPKQPSPPVSIAAPRPPPPPEVPVTVAAPPPPAPAPYNPTISAPPVRYSHVIVGAPVHYAQPAAAASQNHNTEEERPAKRQKMSKAEAMMAKMGYEKGQGLGKNNDGVKTALSVKPRKQTTGNKEQVWDILGGTGAKRKEPSRFGYESKVVVAWGCADDVDWVADADRNDGGIRQELGDMFDDKFGSTERIYITTTRNAVVYIKFISDASALNAVNRFSEGYQYQGRDIRALFYNEDKFDQGVYDH